ncbi:MAG: HD domain-containing protein [Desulfuromonadales bacterium]
MQPLELIDNYYRDHAQARRILIAHSRQVASLAVAVAEHLRQSEPVDVEFVEQAAMLHDIGMRYTDTPKLGCHGDRPYISHGVIGAELLTAEHLPRHALVCERHIGVGLSVEDIMLQGLPLPLRDMQPQTLEEKIVAYADLFFSKTKKGMRTAEMVRASLARHGQHKVAVFDRWHEQLGSGLHIPQNLQ